MKKIGLISDTHGHLEQSVFKHFAACDEIWHAGDIGTIEVFDQLNNFKPLRAVYGNIDGAIIRTVTKQDLYFNVEGVQIFMTHIGGYPGKYNPRTTNFLKQNKVDIFICGHSHILKIIYDKHFKLLHINPGAAGNHGFHFVKTLVRFNLHEGKPSDMEVIELGKRG
jgi:hypothetical protein